MHREPGLSVWSHLTGGVISIGVVAAAVALLPPHPAEYVRRVVGFFDRYLARQEGLAK